MTQSIRNATKTSRGNTNGIQRDWYLVDITKDNLGRVATEIANYLMGKNRADFQPDVDMGGVVVVINSDKVKLSGKKPEKKTYFKYGRQLGSMKVRTLPQQLEKDSTQIVYRAVKGMLPKNRMQDIRMNQRLHIYKDENHNHPNKFINL